MRNVPTHIIFVYLLLSLSPGGSCQKSNSENSRKAESNNEILDSTEKNTPQVAATPTPKPPPNLRAISGGVVNKMAIDLVKPEYPAAAKAVRAKGEVMVQVTIDGNGNVESAIATKGHPLLRKSAERAAKATKFAPRLLGGQIVRVMGVVVYNFDEQ